MQVTTYNGTHKLGFKQHNLKALSNTQILVSVYKDLFANTCWGESSDQWPVANLSCAVA